ncbi:MAG: hypothetical protein HOH95_14450 [Dehalococcoidia bacterium]|jgi:hypothetical protein|nr:hypothetical protein [Dehalococcoidia bacterium]
MGCPVHIWVPMMAAIAPAATVARHRLYSLIPRRREPENPANHIEDMPRWAAVGDTNTSSASD